MSADSQRVGDFMKGDAAADGATPIDPASDVGVCGGRAGTVVGGELLFEMAVLVVKFHARVHRVDDLLLAVLGPFLGTTGKFVGDRALGLFLGLGFLDGGLVGGFLFGNFSLNELPV